LAGVRRGVLHHLIYLAELRARPLAAGMRCPALARHFGTNSAAVALLARGARRARRTASPSTVRKISTAPETTIAGHQIEHAAFVVAFSDFGRSQLYVGASTSTAKVQVVRCGVDAAFLRQGRNQSRTPALSASPAVRAEGPALHPRRPGPTGGEGVPFEMVLAGDGPMRGVNRTPDRRLGLEKQVADHRLVSNDQVSARVLLASRVMVLPSLRRVCVSSWRRWRWAAGGDNVHCRHPGISGTA